MTPHVWPLSLPAQVLHLNEWMRQQLTMTCSEVQHVSGPQEAFCMCFSSLTRNCVCFSFIRSKAQRSLWRDQTTQVQADFTRFGRGWLKKNDGKWWADVQRNTEEQWWRTAWRWPIGGQRAVMWPCQHDEEDEEMLCWAVEAKRWRDDHDKVKKEKRCWEVAEALQLPSE